MGQRKQNLHSGFSTVQILIVSASLAILMLGMMTMLNSLAKQGKIVSDKDATLGLANEIRNIIDNETLCTSAIKKMDFIYPGLDTATGNIPPYILDPYVTNDTLKNSNIPSFPIEFSLPDGRIISESSNQSGLPLEISLLKIYAAQKVFEDPILPTRIYNASVFMGVKMGTQDQKLNSPITYVTSINLVVDKGTNKIAGCSSESSAKALCTSMGGEFDQAKDPSCSFVGGCELGSVPISQGNGSTTCRPLRELIGEVCPAGNYIAANAAGDDIECKSGKRLLSFPAATCSTNGNGSCGVTVNFMDQLSEFDKTERHIESIRVLFKWGAGAPSIGKPCSVALPIATDAIYDINTSFRHFDVGGKKYFDSEVDADVLTGKVLIKSITGGWGGCQSATTCNACISNVQIEVQLDGP